MTAPIDLILSKLDGVCPISGGFKARCPAHNDTHPSLSVSPGNGHGPLLFCHGGCPPESILESIGLRWKDVLPPREKPRRKETRYELRDPAGQIVAVHVRKNLLDGKKIHWELPDGTKNLGDRKLAELPLYAIDRLSPEGTVIVTEGEKAADAILANMIPAVGTVTGASGTPGDDALRPLLSRPVYLWPDADKLGREHMGRIGAALLRLGNNNVYLIDWKGAPEKGDAADLFALEGARDDFDVLMDEAKPFTVQAPEPEREHAPRALEDFRATDLWNARLFVHFHGNKVRYCERLGGWHYFDGKRWARSHNGEVERLAKATVRQMYEMAALEPNDTRRIDMAKHAARTEAAGKITAILELSKTEEGIAAPMEAFDGKPWLLNVENGTVDLTTGELHPHRAEDMLTNLSSAEWKGPDAAASTFSKFLTEAMDGDQEKIDFLQRAAGYTLSGDMREQVFLFLHGPEAAGKGTFARAMADVMGTYARSTEISTFLTVRRDRVRNDVAALVGSRLVTASEPEDGQTFDEGLVKIMTGQDKTTTRFLFREFFEFSATFKLWFQGNHRPHIKSTGGAMWRRLLIIPFTKTVPEEQRDKTLGDRLRTPEERAGILAWAVRGCLEWQRAGLRPPASVRAAVSDYRAAEDRLAPFLEERTGTSEYGQVPVGKLYSTYKSWAEENGERPMSKRSFGLRMEEKGFTPGRTGKRRFWTGIMLVDREEE